MKKIVFLSFFLLLLVTGDLFAQSAGSSGLSFLKIGSGARNIALGDNGAVFADDATAVFYNSSSIANLTGSEISFTHNEWIQGIRTEMLATRFSLFGMKFGLGINSTRVGDIEVRERPGAPLSTFTADFFAVSLGTGFALSKKFDAGVAVKYIYEGMFYEDATGFAVDLSAKYKVSDDFFAVASLRNLGSMNELRSESTKLPVDLRIGGGYAFAMPTQKMNFSAGLEVQKFLSTDDIHLNVGVEGVYDKLIALRLGYQSFYESKGFTAGLGIYWNRLAFDYALSPFSQQLGMGHTFTVRLAFGD
ncbi:MAG: PorV/PorQ family protein [Ignavibacteriales bacterium]|nr:MAG: PorV/PorQ family protein [Ignavibacteriaceae bacterium]MBW7872912.1 PorV/PorQ family protein [Ignavibacteria bacterium]MCZ2142459.1 PorV/PorQ family protein [Ignavibacteriales bacterium]OQY76295.1 MAG: hypothetical protein B6D45_04125 [Ignavibacteriales bacterium UTCHB3]MBV6445341.1 hypothetical protein [Ignavibacteriaceae bacterium]